MNLIKNSKITIEGMNLIEKVFRSDISYLKSKTTRRKLIPVLNNIVDIPLKLLRVNKKVKISLDSLQLNGSHFISNIFYIIFDRMTQYIQNTRAPALIESFNNIHDFCQE